MTENEHNARSALTFFLKIFFTHIFIYFILIFPQVPGPYTRFLVRDRVHFLPDRVRFLPDRVGFSDTWTGGTQVCTQADNLFQAFQTTGHVSLSIVI